MTEVDAMTLARFNKFMTSPVAKLHAEIATEVVSELHLDFEPRPNGIHAVCAMCRGSVAQVTQTNVAGEVGFVYTLDGLASLFMGHFMQRHYEQEGRKDG